MCHNPETGIQDRGSRSFLCIDCKVACQSEIIRIPLVVKRQWYLVLLCQIWQVLFWWHSGKFFLPAFRSVSEERIPSSDPGERAAGNLFCRREDRRIPVHCSLFPQKRQNLPGLPTPRRDSADQWYRYFPSDPADRTR